MLEKQISECGTSGTSVLFWDFSSISFDKKLESLKEALKSISVDHVYFEWLHDLPSIPNIDSIFCDFKIKWSVLASISELWDTKQTGDSFLEWMHQLSLSRQLSNVFVWDRYVSSKIKNNSIPFTVIPDYQDVSIDDTQYDCCEWADSLSLPILGVGGQLYGYRGVTNLIRIAARKPKLNCMLWGLGKWDSLGFLEKFLMAKIISKKRFYVNDGYKNSEQELNHMFKHIDALYIDGSRYPNPSGMVTRARNFGIPVLVELGSGFYQIESRLDKGIHVSSFLSMPTTALCELIVRLKEIPARKAPTADSQITVFTRAWRDASGD